MTVEQFDPKASKKSSNSAESQTTTLDIPSKMIEEQHQAVVDSGKSRFRVTWLSKKPC